jgi:hypothetical protein
MRFATVAALCGALVALPWLSAPTLATIPQGRCTLGLSLAFDVSDSLDMQERALIRTGTAAALTDAEVIYAATRGEPVWMQVVDWAERQSVVIDWRRIATAEDMRTLAADLTAAPLSVGLGSSTYMGDALASAHAQFDTLGGCERQVVDLFTDGDYNGGLPPQAALAEFEDGQDEVNVIYLGNNPAAMERITFGWGSFVMPVPTIGDFQHAMVRKLLREIS